MIIGWGSSRLWVAGYHSDEGGHKSFRSINRKPVLTRFRSVGSTVAVETDIITIHAHGRLTAKGAVGTRLGWRNDRKLNINLFLVHILFKTPGKIINKHFV